MYMYGVQLPENMMMMMMKKTTTMTITMTMCCPAAGVPTPTPDREMKEEGRTADLNAQEFNEMISRPEPPPDLNLPKTD